jgi:hypothetical protein
MAEVDPFTRVHTAIWDALKSSAAWSALIKPGLRIDVTEQGNKNKEGKLGSPADFVNFEIEQGTFSMRSANSKADRFMQEYRCFLASGLNTIIKVNQVKYETYRALRRVGTDLGLGSLVETWNVTNANDDYGKSESHRRDGYSAVFSINVEMMLERAVLVAT